MTSRVSAAIADIPRRQFVSEIFIKEAEKDCALNIGHGQTTSNPSVIAKMLSRLGIGGSVLEIGTGCGWQTALLTKLFKKVYSIETNPYLYERAKHDLQGFDVSLRLGDGAEGWPEKAPFDAIIVCCAMKSIPQALIDQLGGTIIIPIGDSKQQELVFMTRKQFSMGSDVQAFIQGEQSLGPCGFVNAVSP